MKLWRALLVVAILFAATALHADVVVAVRYYKVEGTSHYHLYLYGDDGKLIRQLTSPDDAQDTEPVFSEDGSKILFTREMKGKKAVFSIRPNGKDLHEIEQKPDWYPPVLPEDSAYLITAEESNDPLWTARGDDLFTKTADDQQEVILKSADNFKRKEPSYESFCFEALTIHDLAADKEVRVPTGGNAPENYCDFATCKKSPFLLQPEFRVAFYWQWQGSTMGPRLGVIDLNTKKALFLSQNPTFAVRHGTRAGFFCVTSELYQPLGDTGHTVNCFYLDWWDAQFQRTRFANAISLFGGASVRVKGQPQLNLPKGRP